MKKYLYQSLTKRENLFYFLLLIFPIVFPKYLSSLFDKYINDLVFNNIHSSLLTDFVFFLIGVSLVTTCCLKLQLGYHFNRTKIILLFILSFWYLQIRCNIAWSFTSFYFSEAIKYSDVLPIIACFNILCFLIIEISRISLKEILAITCPSIFRLKLKSVKRGVLLILRLRRNKSNNIVLNRFIPERINTEKEILGRTDYANSIALNIANSYPTERDSYAVAITGKWGSGKTTFLKLIQKKLSKLDRIIIEFHPWRNHESKNLINNFFDLLNNELGEYDPQLGSKLGLYAKQLASLDDNTYFKSIDFILRTIYGSVSTDTLYDEINEAIIKLKKQIIIVIDDIDRLDALELLEVVKLIRSSSNFKNLVFLVAYDKNYVVNTLREQTGHNMDTYLEKIVLVEFNLPSFETERLISEFQKELKKSFEPKYENLIDDYFKFQKESIDIIVKSCITSVRDIRRFVNGFKVNYLEIKDQVVFGEFLNLELIKFKHPKIYNFIEKNHLDFCEDNQNTSFLDDNPYSLVPTRKINSIKLNELWKLDSSLAENDEAMVYKVFNIEDHNLEHKQNNSNYVNFEYSSNSSIRNGLNIINYFGYRLRDKQIGKIEFRKVLNGCSTLWIDQLKIWENEFQFEQVIKNILSVEYVESDLEYRAVQNFIILLLSRTNWYSEKYKNLLKNKFSLNYDIKFHDETINIFRSCKTEYTLVANEIVEYINKQRTLIYNSKYVKFDEGELTSIYETNCENYLKYKNEDDNKMINFRDFVTIITNSSLLNQSIKKNILRKILSLNNLRNALALTLVIQNEKDSQSFDMELYELLFDNQVDFDDFISKVNPKIMNGIRALKESSGEID